MIQSLGIPQALLEKQPSVLFKLLKNLPFTSTV
jgi:hypothetical protein